jgi:hypothetical protein
MHAVLLVDAVMNQAWSGHGSWCEWESGRGSELPNAATF